MHVHILFHLNAVCRKEMLIIRQDNQRVMLEYPRHYFLKNENRITGGGKYGFVIRAATAIAIKILRNRSDTSLAINYKIMSPPTRLPHGVHAFTPYNEENNEWRFLYTIHHPPSFVGMWSSSILTVIIIVSFPSFELMGRKNIIFLAS